MDFFNKLGDSIQNVGKEASKKAKDLSGTVTLNSQIKETETQLERIYKLIGENTIWLTEKKQLRDFRKKMMSS